MPSFAIHSDAASAEFFAAARNKQFLLIKDLQTGLFHGPEFDGSIDPDRYSGVAASGTGHVVSWTVVHQAGVDQPPRIVVGIVELDEGPWWWTQLVGADSNSDLEGAQVQVDFEMVGLDVANEMQPFFRIIE